MTWMLKLLIYVNEEIDLRKMCMKVIEFYYQLKIFLNEIEWLIFPI